MGLAAPSFACDNYPDLPALPGETDAELEARNDRLFERLGVIQDHEAQQGYWEGAKVIYIARILGRTDGSASHPIVTGEVKPVRAIRGDLPPGTRTLSQATSDGCNSTGDGDALLGRPAEWVIVFEGFPKTGRSPNGINSILASQALVPELVDAIEAFGLEQR